MRGGEIERTEVLGDQRGCLGRHGSKETDERRRPQ